MADMTDRYCPVCGSLCSVLDVLDFNRSCLGGGELSREFGGVEYVLCNACGFCHAPSFADWQPDDFAEKIYNQDYSLVDPDYLDKRPRANAASLHAMFEAAQGEIRHLDYGGGNGLMVALLKASGWNSLSVDPYAASAPAEPPTGRFNLITAYEVFEHVVDPKALVRQLAALLETPGLILFSTLVSDSHIAQNRPLDWWYAAPRNGHISLFSRKSLQDLGQQAGLNFCSFNENLHAYWKAIPAWAERYLHAPTGPQASSSVRVTSMPPSNSDFNAFIQTRHGPMLYNRFDRYVGGWLAAYGEFSEGEATMFSQLVGAGHVVVEAGANIGAHTIHLAKRVGEQGAVFAFEPQRIVFQTLCANLALNQLVNVVARQQGLGRQAGEMVLPNVDPRVENNFGGLSLLNQGPGERVGIVTIDGLGLNRCDLIKVDVEGMEEEVIAGALNTIARFRPTLYLENDRVEKSASLIRTVQSLGYRLWWHLSPLFNPDNFSKNPDNVFGGTVSINILCLPRESARPVVGLREIMDANERWDRLSDPSGTINK